MLALLATRRGQGATLGRAATTLPLTRNYVAEGRRISRVFLARKSREMRRFGLNAAAQPMAAVPHTAHGVRHVLLGHPGAWERRV